jgi:hypothetical protein
MPMTIVSRENERDRRNLVESARCNPNPEPPAEFAVKDEMRETA